MRSFFAAVGQRSLAQRTFCTTSGIFQRTASNRLIFSGISRRAGTRSSDQQIGDENTGSSVDLQSNKITSKGKKIDVDKILSELAHSEAVYASIEEYCATQLRIIRRKQASLRERAQVHNDVSINVRSRTDIEANALLNLSLLQMTSLSRGHVSKRKSKGSKEPKGKQPNGNKMKDEADQESDDDEA